ncbi:DUF6527 family protein [Oceanicoccus sp. KOV_DT_Chl]|uniref:DUF6527 family protein n=1 Tax=Oceanicoccus sp. KOV_DT_Chl TaxID=1904639 RepID=UPI000C7C490E
MKVEYVHYMPKNLATGVLYVSEEFRTAAHLCVCGCGSKVRTPLTPTEWQLNVTNGRPTLSPSVGNWQLPCKSHYIIKNGGILWANEWSDSQIELGRKHESEKRKSYYSENDSYSRSIFGRAWNWLKQVFR